MSTEKKTETPKQPKTKSPDSLIGTTKKGDTELTEEELKRAAGGMSNYNEARRPR